jgi:phage gp46-like protein
MRFDRFQGDPALFIDENGAYIEFKGGQPVMDQGLHNAALISLLTDQGYWGNKLREDPDNEIGSDFIEMSKKPIINLKSLIDAEKAAGNALEWMKEKGIASSIDVTASNPSSNQTFLTVVIHPPAGQAFTLQLVKNISNWIMQAKYPAHARQ